MWKMASLITFQFTLPSNIDGIKELVPDIRIERIADCGHFVTWEKPEAVIAAMQTFLAQTN